MLASIGWNLFSTSQRKEVNETKKPPNELYRKCVSSLTSDEVKILSAESKTSLSRYSELGKRIYLLSIKETLDEEEIQLLVQAFKSDEFFKLKPFIAKILENESSKQVNAILKAIFKSHAFEDSKLLLEKIMSLCTLEKIEDVIRSEFALFSGASDTAMQLSKAASRHVALKELNSEIRFNNIISYYVMTTLEWLVESLEFITQLVDVTDPDASKMERQMVALMRYQAFRENLTIVAAGLVALALYTGSLLMTTAIAGAVVVVTLSLYVLYVKYLRPAPSEAHPGINKNASASKGLIPIVYGREEAVRGILATLEGNTKPGCARRYPMVRGATGIGKSDLGNAIALLLTSPECPPEWKGKVLHVVSCADLITGSDRGGKMAHLHNIKDRLKDYEKDSILFFTEAHVGFKDKTFFLGQEFKTMCDGPEGFPHMIFATTDKEYMEYMARDVAFARRLDFYDIDPTPDHVTEVVVSNQVLREAADVFFTPEAIHEVSTIRFQTIMVEGQGERVFENSPQPATSITITSKVLANARHPVFKEQERKLQELKHLRDGIDCHLKLERGAAYLPYSEEGKRVQNQLDDLNFQINALETELSTAKNELDRFRSLVKKTSQLQEEIELAALAIKEAKERNHLSEANLTRFILLLNYLKPAMEESLKDMAREMKGAAAVVDVDLMREFIAAEAVFYKRKVREKELSDKKMAEELDHKSKKLLHRLERV